VELFAYMRIRGPLGPPRRDYELAQLSMYAGSPYPKKVRIEDFEPPWCKPSFDD